MKKINLIVLLVALCSAMPAFAQYSTDFVITNLDNAQITNSIQNTLKSLVSEINSAFVEKRTPSLSNLNIDERTTTSIMMLWENSPFRCDETEIVERVLENNNEYEVRNIPFIFPDLDPDDQYHEVAVTFSKSGKMTSFYITISQNLYSQVLRSNTSVTDYRRRQMILDYVEQFRTAYNIKDITFLDQVFSDDALIITGRVVTTKHSKDFGTLDSPKIKYTKQSKAQYINKLRGIFRGNKRIRVTFDDVKVLMHPTKNNWYGVTLKQGWTTDRYHDDGWLFLLWDFSDEQHPTIHVRTWQPDEINGQKLPEEEIFSIDDCNIVD